MAIIGEKITLDKPLVGNIARNQMESKMELATRGALYVGTGNKTEVTPDGGGDKVPIPETLHIAPNGASDNGKVLVADSKETVGWKITKITADNLEGGRVAQATNADKVLVSTDTYKPLVDALLDLIYPVGSIYMTVDEDSDPAAFLGGTWVRWGQGCVPVGVSADANDSDFGKVEQQGGERKHKLITSEMPNHRHKGQYSATNTYTDHAQTPTDPPSQVILVDQGTREVEVQYNVVKDNVSSTPYHASGSGPTNDIFYSYKVTSTYGVADDGGDIPHNNLQPYITCYMWKRTA